MCEMRMMWVHVLWPGDYVEWKRVPWGKRGFDLIRNQGGTIIGYGECDPE
jgi:hypothetical protein